MAGATVPDVMRALEMHKGGPASAMRVTDSRFTPHPGSKHACNLALRPVLIKVEYAALNPVDVYVMRGRLRLMGVPAKLPGVVGLDIAGTVAEVPGDASASSAAWAPPHDLKVGDRVFGCTSASRQYRFAVLCVSITAPMHEHCSLQCTVSARCMCPLHRKHIAHGSCKKVSQRPDISAAMRFKIGPACRR